MEVGSDLEIHAKHLNLSEDCEGMLLFEDLQGMPCAGLDCYAI